MMRYQSAAAFRQALEARLRQVSRDRGVSLALVRKLVVFERLVARLVEISPDNWIVKGGAALVFRAGFEARTTRDLDLGRRGTVEAAVRDMDQVQARQLGDYFEFVAIRDPEVLPIQDTVVVRFGVVAELDGRRFERISVDVGFDVDAEVRPDRVIAESFLEFANLRPVVIPTIPLDHHLAQKLQAYVRIFPGTRVNTRARDLVDIVLIGEMSTFSLGRLRQAIAATFAKRPGRAVPKTLPTPPPSWSQTYPSLAREVGLDPDLAAGHARAAAFLNPVLQVDPEESATWDPASWSWR